jgi:hypothetical protein
MSSEEPSAQDQLATPPLQDAEWEWNAMLLEYGATPERLPVVKAVLAGVGVTRDNLRELIRFSESRMGMNCAFRGFGGSDAELDQVAADLEAEKTMFQSHYLDHD